MTSQAETLPAAVEAPVGSKPSASAALKDLFVHALVQLRVFRSPYAGIMHLFLFWGVTIQILGTAVNLMQMKLFTPFELASFPRESLYLGYELAMDLAGGAILLGVAMALWRRLVLRPATLPNTLASFVPPVLLLLIALAGFLTEALRFVIVDPPWRAWSPIGNVAAGWLTALGVTRHRVRLPGGARRDAGGVLGGCAAGSHRGAARRAHSLRSVLHANGGRTGRQPHRQGGGLGHGPLPVQVRVHGRDAQGELHLRDRELRRASAGAGRPGSPGNQPHAL